jgi:hypothetical protein
MQIVPLLQISQRSGSFPHSFPSRNAMPGVTGCFSFWFHLRAARQARSRLAAFLCLHDEGADNDDPVADRGASS